MLIAGNVVGATSPFTNPVYETVRTGLADPYDFDLSMAVIVRGAANTSISIELLHPKLSLKARLVELPT